jgi:hypothetical protein
MSKFNAYFVNNITIINDGKKIAVTNTAYEGLGGDKIAIIAYTKKTVIGHKILVSLNATFSNSVHYVLVEYGANTIELRDKNNDGIYESIYTTTRESTVMLFKAAGQMAIGDTWTFSNIKVVDLTQMFGAGNEPTTIEEFEARRPLGVTDGYNEGEIISYDGANELQSIGFNIFDGVYERGRLKDGEFIGSVEMVYTPKYYKILQNTTYFAHIGYYNNAIVYVYLNFYDENKN